MSILKTLSLLGVVAVVCVVVVFYNGEDVAGKLSFRRLLVGVEADVVVPTMNDMAVKVHVTKDQYHAKAATAAVMNITNHGGPVMTAAGNAVFTIYYGDWTTTTTTRKPLRHIQIINNFLNGLGASAWFGLTSTYTDSAGRPIPRSLTNKGYAVVPYNIKLPLKGKSLNDANVMTILQGLITQGKIVPSRNTLYNFVQDPSVSFAGVVGRFGPKTSIGFCGFHCDSTRSVQII
jgi:hypothetical protein